MTELEKTAKKVIDGDFNAQLELIFAFADLGYSIAIRKFEEEKKMLNVDKYREEIDRIIENGGVPRHMLLRMCLQKTNLESVDTAKVLDWLFSEHEPPLLKNGDGLKPGDEVMVRNDEDASWVKRAFLFFYPESSSGRNFACAYDDGDIGDGDYYTWKQARLPEEGE